MRLVEHALLVGRGARHPAPRVSVAHRVAQRVGGHPGDGGQLAQEALVAGGERLVGTDRGEPLPRLLDHRVQPQRVPAHRAEVQQPLHVRQVVAVDRLHLLVGRQQQRPVAQRPQVHLVEEPVEQVGALPQPGGDGLQRGLHALLVGPLHHDDDVVVVTELGEVLLPALLAVLAGADEVVAGGVVLEPRGGGDGRGQAQHQGHEQHQAGAPAHRGDKGNEQPTHGRSGGAMVEGHPVHPWQMGTPGGRPWSAGRGDCRGGGPGVQGEGGNGTPARGCRTRQASPGCRALEGRAPEGRAPPRRPRPGTITRGRDMI